MTKRPSGPRFGRPLAHQLVGLLRCLTGLQLLIEVMRKAGSVTLVVSTLVLSYQPWTLTKQLQMPENTSQSHYHMQFKMEDVFGSTEYSERNNWTGLVSSDSSSRRQQRETNNIDCCQLQVGKTISE